MLLLSLSLRRRGTIKTLAVRMVALVDAVTVLLLLFILASAFYHFLFILTTGNYQTRCCRAGSARTQARSIAYHRVRTPSPSVFMYAVHKRALPLPAVGRLQSSSFVAVLELELLRLT